jgi:hypothetical protein
MLTDGQRIKLYGSAERVAEVKAQIKEANDAMPPFTARQRDALRNLWAPRPTPHPAEAASRPAPAPKPAEQPERPKPQRRRRTPARRSSPDMTAAAPVGTSTAA